MPPWWAEKTSFRSILHYNPHAANNQLKYISLVLFHRFTQRCIKLRHFGNARLSEACIESRQFIGWWRGCHPRRSCIVSLYWRTHHLLLRFLRLHEAPILTLLLHPDFESFSLDFLRLHFGDGSSWNLFSSRGSAMEYRRCQPPCSRFIASDDPHSKCVKCMGFLHAREAVCGISKCKFSGWIRAWIFISGTWPLQLSSGSPILQLVRQAWPSTLWPSSKPTRQMSSRRWMRVAVWLLRQSKSSVNIKRQRKNVEDGIRVASAPTANELAWFYTGFRQSARPGAFPKCLSITQRWVNLFREQGLRE